MESHRSGFVTWLHLYSGTINLFYESSLIWAWCLRNLFIRIILFRSSTYMAMHCFLVTAIPSWLHLPLISDDRMPCYWSFTADWNKCLDYWSQLLVGLSVQGNAVENPKKALEIEPDVDYYFGSLYVCIALWASPVHFRYAGCKIAL